MLPLYAEELWLESVMQPLLHSIEFVAFVDLATARVSALSFEESLGRRRVSCLFCIDNTTRSATNRE